MKNNNVISIARIDGVDEIMKFIDREWKEGHILGINRDYFLYEYKNSDLLNFVISRNKNNKINGILGFLKASSEEDATVWTTMWKVLKGSGTPMLGVELLRFLQDQGYKSVMSSGINRKTEEIYKYLGFHGGVLHQYFIPNQELREHKIAIIPDSILNKEVSFGKENNWLIKKISLKELEEKFEFKKYQTRIPYKDSTYFKKRFYEHPIYRYDVYGIYNYTNLLTILVLRVVGNDSSTCMRIVDIYGEEAGLSRIIWYLTDIMYSQGHEYIDLFCVGLSESIIFDAGFLKVDESRSDIIIPNYFEPFVQSNIGINYFSDTHDLTNLRVYKADGDQDRPSLF